MTAHRKELQFLTDKSSDTPLAFASCEDTAQVMRSVLMRRGGFSDSIVIANPDEIALALSQMETPPVLIVDLGSDADVFSEVERLATVCDLGTKIILAGAMNDLRSYRRLIDEGVSDYLPTPFDADELERALDSVEIDVQSEEISAEGPSESAPGDVIGIVGSRGGVGASTMAANLSSILSSRFGCSTTLIDLDLTFGTQAVTFDVEPGNGLAEAMAEPDRMDELFVQRAAVTLNEELRLIASETDPSRGEIVSSSAVMNMISIVREMTKVTIVDMPRHLLLSKSNLASMFDSVVVVSDPSLSGMRDTGRLGSFLSQVNSNVQMHVLLNKVGGAPKFEIDKKTFSDGAAQTILGTVNFDLKAFLQADASGKVLAQIPGGSKKLKVLENLSLLLTDLDSEANKRTRVQEILRRLIPGRRVRDSGDVR